MARKNSGGAPSIHELFRRVREHPEYVFGAIFTAADLPAGVAPHGFPAGPAEDALTSRGNEYISELQDCSGRTPAGCPTDADDGAIAAERAGQATSASEERPVGSAGPAFCDLLTPVQGLALYRLSVEQARGGPNPTLVPISPRRTDRRTALTADREGSVEAVEDVGPARTYVVTAAYADQGQVYETEVEASSAEEAEIRAQHECLHDNGGEDGDDYLLVDVFARPKDQTHSVQ